VARTALIPLVMVVNNNVPAKNLKEFIAYAKANPGKLNFASGGNGGISHLMPEMFKQASGTFIVHIPYKGSAPALTDVMGGQAQMMADSIPLFTQYIKGQGTRAGGNVGQTIAGAARCADDGRSRPEGIRGGGLLRGAGTGRHPKDIVDKLSAALRTVLADPDTKAKLEFRGPNQRGSRRTPLRRRSPASRSGGDRPSRHRARESTDMAGGKAVVVRARPPHCLNHVRAARLVRCLRWLNPHAKQVNAQSAPASTAHLASPKLPPRQRSIIRPSTYGPRSLMRTTTDFPVANDLTRTWLPSGNVRWAAVKALLS
jgi:hypothetical protein